MNIKSKLLTATAMGALIIGSLATPVFAATDTIQVSGNGSSSSNTASVHSSNDTSVVQNNKADISNHISTQADTGYNNANGNTGGSTLVATGNANSTVNVTNKANANIADLSNCGCATTSDLKISGNGSDSTNQVKVGTDNSLSAFQNNNANITNDIKSQLSTGGNIASGNTSSTSGGTVTVLTGDANSTTTVKNLANANVLTQGTGGSSGGSGVTATVSGNGSSSDNSIHFYADNSATVVQDNMAKFKNDVDNWLGTGYNNANGNTGADVAIGTGNANATTNVDNLANFNAANLDCACITDVTAKVSGNGSDSENTIKAHLDNDSSIFQGGEGAGNNAYFSNWLDTNGSVGGNNANGNTGPVSGDPVRVFTGNSNTNTTVSNSGGVNIAGPGAISLPGGNSLELSFSMSDLLALLHS